jgi:hypothetical protein
MFFRLKKYGERGYVQIVENKRDGAAIRQTVIANLGRADELAASGALASLIASGAKLSDQVLLISALDEDAEGALSVAARDPRQREDRGSAGPPEAGSPSRWCARRRSRRSAPPRGVCPHRYRMRGHPWPRLCADSADRRSLRSREKFKRPSLGQRSKASYLSVRIFGWPRLRIVSSRGDRLAASNTGCTPHAFCRTDKPTDQDLVRRRST